MRPIFSNFFSSEFYILGKISEILANIAPYICSALLFYSTSTHIKYTVKSSTFPSPAGCHLPNSPWRWIIKLFPARGSLVGEIPAADGEIENPFLQCNVTKYIKCYFFLAPSNVSAVYRAPSSWERDPDLSNQVNTQKDTYRAYRPRSHPILHKVLTYVEYRAVSGVFQNIDPPPPLQPSKCLLPKGVGPSTTLARPGWMKPEIAAEVDTARLATSRFKKFRVNCVFL